MQRKDSPSGSRAWGKGNKLCFCSVQPCSPGWKETGIWAEIFKKNKIWSLHWNSWAIPQKPEMIEGGTGGWEQFCVLLPEGRQVGEKQRGFVFVGLFACCLFQSSIGVDSLPHSSQDLFCEDAWKLVAIKAWKLVYFQRYHIYHRTRNIFLNSNLE